MYLGSDLSAELRLSTVAANPRHRRRTVLGQPTSRCEGTIVATNAGGDLAGEGSATLDRSLVQDPRGFRYVDSGGSIIGEDPRLGPLGDHGGPTATMLPASNSPVIDAGSAFGATTDQRGSPRPVDDADTPDAVDGSDIGAVELTEAELAGPPQVGNTAPPTITGRPRVGETLHTDGGGWAPEDVSLTLSVAAQRRADPRRHLRVVHALARRLGRHWYGAHSQKRVSVRVTASAAGHRDGSVVSDFTDPVNKGFLSVRGLRG